MYTNFAGNAIPEKYTATRNFDGNLSASETPIGANTFERQRMVQVILSSPGSLDINLTNIFSANEQECRAYVESKGEIPSTNIIRLASQVCLLRAMDISNQSCALECTDEDALKIIENTEEGLQSINSPDTYSMLSFNTQAAAYIILDKLATQINGGSMYDLICLLRGEVDDYSLNGFSDGTFTIGSMINNADGEDSTIVPIASVITPGLAVTDPSVATPINIANITNASALMPDASAGSSSGGILGFLSGIVNTAQQVAQTAQQVASSTSSVKNSVNSILGGVGASSISTYLNNNKGLVAAWAIGIVVIIVIIVYAAKNSH